RLSGHDLLAGKGDRGSLRRVVQVESNEVAGRHDGESDAGASGEGWRLDDRAPHVDARSRLAIIKEAPPDSRQKRDVPTSAVGHGKVRDVVAVHVADRDGDWPIAT